MPRMESALELQEHIGLPDESFYLWKAIIAFEHYPFQLLGCGEDHSMAIKFTYETSTTSSAGRRHYSGISVKG